MEEICFKRSGRVQLMPIFLFLTLTAACAETVDRVNDVYEIRLKRTEETSSKSASGSSSSNGALVERVVALRDGGMEVVFDLPKDTPAEDKMREWQFPARVFRAPGRALQLLNAAEAEARLRKLMSAQERALCGRWVFTWTAQKIECDPKSVLGIVEPFIRPVDVRAGALVEDKLSKKTAKLKVKSEGTAKVASAEFQIDPDVIRKQRTETDVIVAELMGQKNIDFEAALSARQASTVSGTVVVNIEISQDGSVIRRSRKIVIDIKETSGEFESTKTTEIVTWQRQ
jgi:hypothetical protein